MPPAWLGNIESEKYRCWICKPTKGVFSNPDGFLQGIYTILQKIHRRFQVIHGYSQPSNLHPVNIHREIIQPDPWFQAERCASKKLQPLPTLNMDLVESVPWQNVGLIYRDIPRTQMGALVFAWKNWRRPCFEGLTFKNRGHWGSRYIHMHNDMMQWWWAWYPPPSLWCGWGWWCWWWKF